MKSARSARHACAHARFPALTGSATLAVLVLSLACGAGCSSSGGGAASDGGILGMDAGAPGMDLDAGDDATLPPMPDAAQGPAVPGCNTADGIECDGDWSSRCHPACGAGACCSPQRGSFRCVPRDDAGLCPVADLFIDATKITDDYAIESRSFPADDCALVEGCVGGSGRRRLLRFDTWTPNVGQADMFLGAPSRTSTHFTYSSCHDHYHFNTYAAYELLREDGSVAATGHKQAFCLLDFYTYPDGSDVGSVYNCSFQGIQRGWQDVYDRDLDCQWVDITGVAPGDYRLRIRLNTEHLLAESNYDNNEIVVPVHIPETDPIPDLTAPCTRGEEGTDRRCGFTREGVHACTPGAHVRVSCSAACSLGRCTGDPMMRVCAGDGPCNAGDALGTNDDSECGAGMCDGTTDCCPLVTFDCPATGQYTVFWGAYDSRGTATCDVAVSP